MIEQFLSLLSFKFTANSVGQLLTYFLVFCLLAFLGKFFRDKKLNDKQILESRLSLIESSLSLIVSDLSELKDSTQNSLDSDTQEQVTELLALNLEESWAEFYDSMTEKFEDLEERFQDLFKEVDLSTDKIQEINEVLNECARQEDLEVNFGNLEEALVELKEKVDTTRTAIKAKFQKLEKEIKKNV